MKKQRAADHYQASNQECAQIILRDIDRYGGEESLMVRWARLVVVDSSQNVQAREAA